MKTQLLKGLDPEQQNEIKRQFTECTLFREQAKRVLEEDRQGAITLMTNEVFGPNWEFEQAYRIAQVKVYDKLIALL